MRSTGIAAVVVVVMAIGLGAVAAPTFATAGQHFSAAEYPATIQGSGKEPSFDIGGKQITCATSAFTGNLTAASETLSLKPKYGSCRTLGYLVWLSVNVEAHGCQYTLHTSEVLDVASTSGESCKEHPMTLKVSGGCEITIGPQAGIHYARYINETGGKVGVSFANGSITYHSNEYGGNGCPLNGEPGTMLFSGTLTAETELGEADALTVK